MLQKQNTVVVIEFMILIRVKYHILQYHTKTENTHLTRVSAEVSLFYNLEHQKNNPTFTLDLYRAPSGSWWRFVTALVQVPSQFFCINPNPTLIAR